FTITRQHVGADATDNDADATGFAGRYTLASGDAVTTVDAGFYRPASYGDRVWLDLNGNGQQDADEAGVAGVRVTLLDATGTAIGSPQLTDANGNYAFTGLAPGVYSVSFDPATLPAGYSVSSRATTSGGPDGITVQAELGSGQVNLSGDLGLTGRVGLDIEKYVHGEVLQQSYGLGGEGLTPGFWKNHTGDGGAPLSGWPETGLVPTDSFESLFGVDVPGSAPTLLQALSTNGGGVSALLRHASAALLNAANPNVDYFYSREQIVTLVQQAFASGDYEAAKNLFAAQNELGADLSTPATATGSTLLVSPDEDADTLATAPVIAAGGQAVFTYEVTNTGTVALSDVRVSDDRIAAVSFVGGDDDHDGQLDVGETWIYTAHETVQAGAVVTNVGTATARDAVSGRTASDIDVAIYTSTGLSQSVGDRVWLDANANGIQDAGEAGFAGVTVQLRSATGTLLQTTTTDADGNYAFNVAAGSYQLAVVAPTGYVLSSRDLGGNDATDSDFDPATHATTTVTVGAGQQVLTVDAGLHVAGTPGLDLEKLVHAEYYNQQAGGGEGLTPGFWKNHTGDGGAPLSGWPETGLSPNASFEALFGVDVPGSAPTLVDALATNGGGVNALLRHAAAALLNASDPYIDYLYSREQVVSLVRQAFASGDYETAKNLFATQNELGADLATPAGSVSTLVVTADVDADTAAGALVIPAAGTALYTYVLTNTGNVALSTVSVSDDRLGGITFVGGDTDRDGQLDVGETWTYTAREAVAAGATLSSTGTASGRDAADKVVSDSDAAHVSSSALVQTLGDKVWLDANGNGVQDTGEAGVTGVTVKLMDATGSTVLATTTTTTGGAYAFNGLAPGDYRVQVVRPSGYQAFTRADQGTNDLADSDVDANGLSGVVHLSSGTANAGVDAGFAPNTVTLTYSFDGNTAVDGTDGNTRSYSVGGVSVTASAFSRDAGGTWSKAYLGAYTGGLGVTDASENGSGATHTLDNVGRLNFVVLQFSQNVVVDKAYLGYVYGDSDLTAWIGSSATTLTSLSSSVLGGMASEANDTISTTTRWADLNAGAREGNVLVIAASVTDTKPDDYFKLGQLVVSTKSTTITPLALDLDGDGVETVARADSAGSFDLLGNGHAVASGWIAADDALLAMDVNGNGRIDDIHELFGGTGDGAGFTRLAALDGNGDGFIDARDAHFGELLAWRDLNGDHQSSADELMTLSEAGIASLSVGFSVQAFYDAQGNLHQEHGVATRADGSSLQVTDVHFDTGLGSVAAAPAAVEEGGDLLSLLGTTLHTSAALHALAV
ncbi:SdrD B-like domain-containing protein, partial [Azohydromonas lata]|uniref:SdrD B-like domain-containing protein n=1 Tax=Azohydromonas lata TaxID=45677 RepID=UPI00157CF6AC